MGLMPLLKSAITFSPTAVRSNEKSIDSACVCLEWASELAVVSGEFVGVTVQHSLKHDKFVVMVECGQRTFSAYGKSPKVVFDTVSKRLFKYIERINATIQTKEHPARTKSRRRHRR